MRNKLEKICSSLLILMILTNLIISITRVYAADIANGTSGTCSWVIDGNGVLTISPTNGTSGTLDDYPVTSQFVKGDLVPWHNYRSSVTKVVVTPGVKTSTGNVCLFYNMTNCTEMNLANLDTSAATSMLYMFENCSSLTTLNLSTFNTANVSNMGGMFINCSSLTNLNLAGFNTSSATYMSHMFENCSSLSSLDLSSFNTYISTTSNVTDMSYMFAGCTNLNILNIPWFNTSNVTSMSHMFENCTGLTSLDLSGLNIYYNTTSNVTDMAYMFAGCSGLTNLNLASLNTGNVTTMSHMFENCSVLTSLNLSSFNTSKVTDMASMFKNCNALETVQLGTYFSFKGNNITNVSLQAILDAVPTNNDYTGKWIRSNNANGPYTPAELRNNYNGFMAGEWIWQKATFTVSYLYTGFVPFGVSALPASASYRYGDTVTVAQNATAPAGYTFSGWSRTGTFTMPAEDVTITGSFIPATDTPYKVEHYQQNLNDNNYTLYETENLTGTTGTQVTATPKTYDGFTYNYWMSSAMGFIAGDGSLVLRLYYSRTLYTVTYSYTGTVPEGASALPATASYRYGATVTVAPDATAPGYTFSGWSRTGTFTMPEENVEITGSFTPNPYTGYTIEHYQQNINNNDYTLAETETQTGMTGSTVTAMPKNYNGFTYNYWISSAMGTVAGDGSLVLRLYYTRNSYNVTYSYIGTTPPGASALPATASYRYGATVTVAPNATAPGYTFSGWSRTGTFTMPANGVNITGSFIPNPDTPYTIEHYTKNLGTNTYTLHETENKTGTTGAQVTASPKSYDGFTFDSTITGTIQSGYILGSGNLVLKLYYTRNSYEVSYAYTTAPVSASLLPADQNYEYGATVTVAPDATAPGYTFSGWSRTGTFTMPAEDVEITGGFTANTNTPYKVEHYTKDLGSNTYSLRETENKSGTTDTLVTAVAKDYEGFTFDNTIPGTLQSDYISGDGNLTLKLYYTRNSYNVSYAYQGIVPNGASTLPANTSYEYGAEVTVAPDATAPGYTFSGWNRTGTFLMPASNVSITGSFTANTDTPYTIEHYTKNIGSNTYSLRETENKTGTTGSFVTAVAKDYTGFTYNMWIPGTIQNGTIAGNGNLVLKLYYTRNSYTVSYAYQGTVPQGASALPSNASYEYDEEVTVAAAATAPGYTFSGWNRTGTFNMPAENVTIKGSFSSNSDTMYKVEHYWKNLNANTYTLHETETLYGETDTEVTATPNTYEGFTFDSTIAGTIQSGNILGNGNLVLKLYYTRNSYNVSYEYTSAPASAPVLPANQTYQYGASVTVISNPSVPGYTFSGWSRTGTFTMPAEDVEITGGFTANTNTPYTIEHYQQNIANNNFTLFETENKTGTTDELATANQKNYEGFTFDSSIPGTIQSGNIAGNGNLVLKLYYTRNSYTVSYAYQGTVPAEASTLPQTASYKYGATVTVAANATAPGYTFSGWSRTDTFTMPAEDVEITGGFTANTNTSYAVEHYWEDLNANTYTLHETETFYGKTDTEVTASANTYTGFTFNNTVTGTIQSGNIAGNGSLILKLYYTRNSYEVSYAYTTAPVSATLLPADRSYEFEEEVTVEPNATAPGYTFSGWSRTGTFNMPAQDVEITGGFTANTNTPYKVEHYTKDIGTNTYTLKETENKTGTTDTLATANPKSYEGFTFDGNIPGTLQSDYIAGDGNLILKLYYTRNSYDVSYAYQGTIPNGASTLPSNASYEYGAEVTVAAAATAPGYTFSGWNRTGTFNMPAEDVIIKGSFSSNSDTTYKVEHYWKNLNANTYTLHETENLHGETDTTVTAVPNIYTGFTFDNTIVGTTQSGNIAGDGSLVLKLYYTRNSYNVTYSFVGYVPAITSNLPTNSTYEYGAQVTVAAAATAPRFIFSGWSRTGTFTMAAEDVEITGSFTARNDIPYTVEHYIENLNANSYTIKETETFYGTTDQAVPQANPKNYEGFTFDENIPGTVLNGFINQTEETLLKLYYTRNSYDVTYSYSYAPVSATLLPADRSYEYEEIVSIEPNATAPGYTFSGWSVTGTYSGIEANGNFEMPAGNVSLTGGFTANTSTPYTIEHYIKDIGSDTYTLKEIENKTGTTDTLATATPKNYEGFTFNNGPSTTSGNIDGNGNLVLKLYYTRNSYTVSYQYQGVVPTGASQLPQDATYEYEAEVTVAPNATAPGYTFNGWNRTGTFNMPAGNVSIIGSFASNQNTLYKVEHYLKNINLNTYTLHETENLYGETDTQISATPKTYTGFTFDNTITGTEQSGTITGDGNLVLKLYYTRNSYDVLYAYIGTVPTGATPLPSYATYEYGAEVTVAPAATAPGYTFSGWNRSGTFTMPAGDVGITGSFTANTNTSYKVEHYKEDLNADTFTLFETETLAGTTDTLATATSKDYNGFTFNSGLSTSTGNISGDGNLVLKLYYSRNSYSVTYRYEGYVPTGATSLPPVETYEYEATITLAADSTAPGYTFSGWTRTRSLNMPAQDVEMTGSFTAKSNTPYKIEHYLEDLNADTYTLKQTINLYGTTDTTATAAENTYEGFTFNNSISSTYGNIDGNGNLVLTLYYTRNSYTVSYRYNNAPVTAPLLPADQSYEYEEEVTVVPNVGVPGYTFSGWSRTGTFNMPAQNVEITGTFTANGNTAYRVEHYIKDVNANTFTLKDTDNLQGATDQEVTAIAKNYTGFTCDKTIAGTNQTGIITADGNLVLKLYYTRNSYTVSYKYNSAPATAPLLPANRNYEYEAEVVVEPDVTVPGYTFSGWSRTGTFNMPAQNVEINGAFVPNSDTPYTIEHYTETEDGSFELRERENLTGVTNVLVIAQPKEYDGLVLDENNANSVKSGNIKGDGTLVLKLYYTKVKYEYKVEYYFDGVIDNSLEEIIDAELDSEVMANPTTPVKHAGKNYTLVSSNHQITISINNEDNIINIYYETDVLNYNIDHYEDDNEGDGIPDKYQIEIKLKVENGIWDDGTTGPKIKALTLLDENGEPSPDGTGVLVLPEIGNNPNDGYAVGDWNEEIPSKFTLQDNGREFTYSYHKVEKEEEQTDIIEPDKGASNPKTADKIQRYLDYGIIGMILMLISIKISKKYSSKAKKIQY